MKSSELSRGIHELKTARVQRHVDIFTRKIDEYFGKPRPEVEVESAVLGFMRLCALGPEEANPLLARYGYTFPKDDEGEIVWNLKKIEPIKPEESELQVKLQPPMVIRVKEMPVPEKKGRRKKNSDGEVPGTDRNTRWSRGT